MKFRKKPIVIDAVLWDGKKETLDVLQGMGMVVESWSTAELGKPGDGRMHCLAIKTILGDMAVGHGDWIVRDRHGNFSVCKPDIFEATYEAPDAAPQLSEAAGRVMHYASGVKAEHANQLLLDAVALAKAALAAPQPSDIAETCAKIAETFLGESGTRDDDVTRIVEEIRQFAADLKARGK